MNDIAALVERPVGRFGVLSSGTDARSSWPDRCLDHIERKVRRSGNAC